MNGFLAKCDRAVELLGTGSDAVLIVPPFADLYRASLGVHLLQAAAEEAGLRVKVFYANLLFAAISGEDLYNTICYSKYCWMWGERIFAATAFGLPHLGYQTEELLKQIEVLQESKNREVSFDQLVALEREAGRFCRAVGERLAALDVSVAGATTTFHQTAASVALLDQIRRARPDAITVIGGANCEGEMAHGIASLGGSIDYIFSGECESVFPDFLRRAVAGRPGPADRIVRGQACRDMDSLPEPCFEDYFAQLDNALPSWRERAQIWLPYESSRGCWWGARHHCTFCGLNGETMTFRQKSPERLIAGLQRLLQRYPTRLVGMIDNIMPHSYFRTVLPRLAGTLPPAHIFYETKANLSLDQVQLLRDAGVGLIQPGIEALSSSLLRRMRKGVLARQNLALLRYARAAGLAVNWNLLYGFPGDRQEDYDSTLALIPLIRHLSPPTGLYPVSIDRFSPYFDEPARHGISGIQPAPGYSWTFPSSADVRRLAYHFVGEYSCAHTSEPELYGSLDRAYREWRDCWKADVAPPTLSLVPIDDSHYLLMDTRGLKDTQMVQFLSEDQVRTVLVGGPLHREPLAGWAIERKLAVPLDGWCVPLAVAEVDMWRRFGAATAQAADAVVSFAR